MQILQQILFVVIAAIFFVLLRSRVLHIKSNIALGKDFETKGDRRVRLRNMLLMAFGQRKMFKRPVPALLHVCVYAGFLVINLEVMEFVIDGLAGTHRIFAPLLGAAYPVALNLFELLAAAVLIACVIFLLRRNVLKLGRFWSAEMKSWPRLDANLILLTEIFLMVAILSMNAADQVLQARGTDPYVQTGRLVFSSILTPWMETWSTRTLVAVERGAWWLHIVGIFGFAVYITYSKHLHIFMAFPNTYYADHGPRGRLASMPVVTREVKSMLGLGEAETPQEAPGLFGAKDVSDLTWKNLMDAYACTECGRCTSECPASITGKKLSPRKIMMDVRDRMEELGRNRNSKGADDGRALLDDYISREEINACTSCQACVEACPVLINPLDVIMALRRYVAMEESAAPRAWNMMFQNVETNFAPWKFPHTDRFAWAKGRQTE